MKTTTNNHKLVETSTGVYSIYNNGKPTRNYNLKEIIDFLGVDKATELLSSYNSNSPKSFLQLEVFKKRKSLSDSLEDAEQLSLIEEGLTEEKEIVLSFIKNKLITEIDKIIFYDVKPFKHLFKDITTCKIFKEIDESVYFEEINLGLKFKILMKYEKYGSPWKGFNSSYTVHIVDSGLKSLNTIKGFNKTDLLKKFIRSLTELTELNEKYFNIYTN